MKESEKLTIQPGIGVAPILFGMTPDDVANLFNTPPKHSRITHKKERQDAWELNGKLLFVVYEAKSQGVVEVTLSPAHHVWINNAKILGAGTSVNPIKYLQWLDNEPLEGLGVLVFSKISISTSGFHNNEKSQESLTVGAPGRFASILHRLNPYKA